VIKFEPIGRVPVILAHEVPPLVVRYRILDVAAYRVLELEGATASDRRVEPVQVLIGVQLVPLLVVFQTL
jgi:hypothetical protein